MATAVARRAGRGDGGFTIIELIVVMLITSIIMAMFIPFAASVTRASQTTTAEQQATAAGRVALQDLAVQLSSADQVCLLDANGSAPTAAVLGSTCPEEPTNDALEIYTYAFGAPHWVQWWYEAPSGGGNGLLEEQSWLASGSPSSAQSNVIAGSASTAGLTSCSVAPGSDGMFQVTAASSTARASATISLEVTCTVQHVSSTVSMQSTVTALQSSQTVERGQAGE